jgi:hypothetical protein
MDRYWQGRATVAFLMFFPTGVSKQPNPLRF